MRLLFCLFADSIDLLPNHLFRRLVESDDRFTPRIFLRKLKLLFQAMANPEGTFGEHTIKYFNGGLFNSDSIIEMDVADLGILHTASKNYDWSHIAPEIFGTLFERSLNAKRRNLVGAHYTSEADILLLIEPVVMDPLKRRWQQVRESILALLYPGNSPAPIDPIQSSVILSEVEEPRGSQRHLVGSNLPDPNPPSSTVPQPSLLTSNPRAETLLAAWFDELSAIRILDPACGSGNFLYVALKQLLELWNEARRFAIDHNIQIFTTYAIQKMVSPEQLFGIEVDSYAHELASIVVWIGFLQWKRESSIIHNPEPILRKLTNIELNDAILRYDSDGIPYEPTWPEADFIIGNPPFLGDKKMRSELNVKPHLTYVENLRSLYANRVPGGADLVTYWFEKARDQISVGKAKRAGLLATNSISMVGNRPVLGRIKQTGDIFMAWSDRAWTLDGAAVRVSMIGFDDGTQQDRVLDALPVAAIHADLSSESNVAGAVPLYENKGLCFLGMMKGGPFDITNEEAAKMLSWPLNPNGRHNADVVKRRIGGQDLTGRDRGGWIVDFQNLPEAEAALYEAPFEYAKFHVKPFRDLNRDTNMKAAWWLHGRSRPALRKAIATLKRYAATPEVAKHRIFRWIDSQTIPDHKLHVIAREDDYFFGVLHSKAHEVWTIATCSWIGKGNDPSYNSATTFETFPFPYPPSTEPSEADSPNIRAIAEAARELVRLRDNWLNPPGASEAELKSRTLTNLYNLRAAGKCTWLENAHRTLDEAVFAAYGWPSTLSTQEILARLLGLNHQRAAAQPVQAANPRRPKAAKLYPGV